MKVNEGRLMLKKQVQIKNCHLDKGIIQPNTLKFEFHIRLEFDQIFIFKFEFGSRHSQATRV